MFCLYLCTLFLFKGIRCEDGANDTLAATYRNLRTDLKKDYDPQARPVIYNSNITFVKIHLHLVSNFYVDEEGQTLCIDSYMELNWSDSYLSWDPKHYKYIPAINFSPNDVWTPDITELRNGGPTSDIRQSDFSLLLLDHSGSIYWFIASALPGRCTFNYDNYPVDVAECKMIFELWSYLGDAVHIDAAVLDYQTFENFPKKINSQWALTGISVKSGISNFTEEFFPSATFTVSLTRKTPTMEQQLMWITSIVVVLLTLGMFWIPSDIEQKITVGCITMVIMTAVLLTLTSSVRAKQPVIIIASTIHNLIFVVTTAIVLEIIAINLQHIQEWKPPEFLLNIFSGTVGKILLISSAQQETPALDKMKLSEYESGDVMLKQLVTTGNWKTISQAVDRVAFILYVIILIAIPKTP